jgi:hypothetical protein
VVRNLRLRGLFALSIHAGADTGGCGQGLAGAFRRYPQENLTFRSIVRSTNYINYPQDLNWSYAREMTRRADLYHFHNGTATRKVVRGQPKPFVLHQHGTSYREDPERWNTEVRSSKVPAAQVVSTLDLLDLGPNTWIPQVLDIDWAAKFRAPQPGRRLRVGHAPTDRAIKSTDAFLAACDRLDVEPVLIERSSWMNCLKVKGTIDVFFDQVTLGYGNNAIEAWAMGIPVIAGGAPETLAKMRATFGGDLPFIEATESTIADAIRLLMDEPARLEWGKRGHDHAVRWHDGRESVERLSRIYRELAT